MDGPCRYRLLNMAGVLAIAFAAPESAYAAVTISSGTTQNVSCSGGVCSPTASDAVLNVGDLENLLASGNVEVTTTSSGVQAKDIAVKAAVGWTSGSALALDAYRSIAIDKPVSVSGTSALALTTDDGGRNGTLSFGGKGDVTFASLSSGLTIDGAAYTLVNTVKGLAAAIAGNPAGDYALAGSFDAKQDGTYDASPVSTTFSGTFEGLGNDVSNLSIKIKYKIQVDLGLFSELAAAGTLRDIGLVNASVLGFETRNGMEAVGTLVGDNFGTVFQATASGTVQARKKGNNVSSGGLVGVNEQGGTIEGSSAAASAWGAYAGGLVGINGGTVMLDSASGAAAAGAAGGLVGYNNRGAISLSYATGAAQGGGAGGLVGANNGTIATSYATGSVTADLQGGFGGGLVGSNGAINGNGGTITQSYATGEVTGGGGDDSYLGGFVGSDDSAPGSLTYCYWDTDTSGIANLSQGAGNVANDPGITGLTTQQLQASLPAGFDPTIWTENPGINDGLPYLIANRPKK